MNYCIVTFSFACFLVRGQGIAGITEALMPSDEVDTLVVTDAELFTFVYIWNNVSKLIVIAFYSYFMDSHLSNHFSHIGLVAHNYDLIVELNIM